MVDLKNHKSSFFEIFSKFRTSGWKKLPIYILLPLYWILAATDVYDLSARLWTFGMIAFAPLAKAAFDQRMREGPEAKVDNVFLIGVYVTGIFIALVNFGSHISYQKIVNFNQSEGLFVKIDDVDTKCIIIFASKDHKVLFTGSNFLVFDKDIGWIKRKFTEAPLDRRPYFMRISGLR